MKTKIIEELRPEYEFDYSKAVRGKYVKRLIEEGANVAVLDPEVAKVFTSSAAVNEALKSLLEITKSTQRLTSIWPPVVKGKSSPIDRKERKRYYPSKS